MQLVFVYGTLKRGGSNHGHMAGQEFVGQARTAPGFRLFDLGGYPGMAPHAADRDGVAGEVWSVDESCLHRLDELEGVPHGPYRREIVPLVPPFADQSVEAYVYTHGISGCADLGSAWNG